MLNGDTHKEYHVGHLRNIAFGDAVNRIIAANGYTSVGFLILMILEFMWLRRCGVYAY